MNMKLLVLLTASLVLCQSLGAREVREIQDLADIFKKHGVTGTFVMLDPETETLSVSNGKRSTERFVPASTFKIPNSLIALQTGVVANVDEVVPYGGKPQRLKQWERDMNVRDAIKASSVPIYQELARRVGLERMRDAVRSFGYGNMEVGEAVDRFWLDGPLKISAVEQVEFLQRLASGALPVKPENLAAVKEITLLEKTDAYALHGKTGWYWPGERGQQIGWWVGWIERDGKHYPFAFNIDINADEDATKRIPIARECLKRLGKL